MGEGLGSGWRPNFTHIEVDIGVLGRDQSCERENYHSPCLPEAPGRARRSPLCARGEAKISVGAWTGVGGGAKKRRDAEIGHGFSPARGQGCAAVWSSAHQGGGSGRALNIRAGSGRPHLLLGPGFQHDSPCRPGSATCSSAQVVGENVIATYQGRSARAAGLSARKPALEPICCGSAAAADCARLQDHPARRAESGRWRRKPHAAGAGLGESSSPDFLAATPCHNHPYLLYTVDPPAGSTSAPVRRSATHTEAVLRLSTRRCEVESGLIVPADRPSFSLFGDPDSVRPTDRLAARSAAKQNLSLFGSEDPTDRPSFIARGGSETFSRRFSLFYPTDRPSSDRPHRIGAPDRPTLPQAELGR